MAKNLVFGIEDDEVIEVVPAPAPVHVEIADDSVIESELLTQEAFLDGIDESLNIHDEGSGILETTNTMITLTEEAIDSGEGLPASTAGVINAAMEHFYNRAGIDLGKDKILALESNSVKVALSDTKTALEDMKAFSKRLDKALVVSQEGMLSRLGNSFKLAFTNRDKIHDSILLNMNAIKTHGSKEGVIKEPGWGRSFAIQGKRLVSGAEVVGIVKNYTSIVTSSQMKKLLNEYTDLLEKITKEVSKSLLVAKDEATKNIYDLAKQSESLRVKVDKIINSSKKTAGNDPSFTPLKEAEAQKLTDMVNNMFTDSELRTAIKRCDAAIGHTNNELYYSSLNRVAGTDSADIRAARGVINKTNDVISDISYILSRMDRVAFACSNYIKASTAR